MTPGDWLRLTLPRWWRGESGWLGRGALVALTPAETVYRGIVAGRNSLYDRGVLTAVTPAIPVISVGNLTVGGTGKTPFTAWLASRLLEWGRNPAIVLRGYGADEVELHRSLNSGVPVLVGKSRRDGVELAGKQGADCALLDDGFQHRQLDRELDIVLIGAEQWRRPRRMIPRGPWREPLSQLSRAERIVITRKAATHAEAEAVRQEVIEAGFDPEPAIAYLKPGYLGPLNGSGDPISLHVLEGRRVAAISSIAEPHLFFDQLRDANLQVQEHIYPDHHEFTADDVREIVRAASGVPILMTRKESVKLKSRMPADADALVLGQEVVVESGGEKLFIDVREALTR